MCVYEKVSGGKNGCCQRVARATGKLPSFFPSFARQRAGPIILPEVTGGGGSLTQRNASPSDGEHAAVTRHILQA